MKHSHSFLILTFTLLVFAWGCNKETEPEPPISAVPSIKFISMSPDTAVKYQDLIKIKIEYTDGDGDLGENTPDVKNLFCTDSRNNVTYEFRMHQLAPDSSKIAIKGQLTFDLAPQGFIDDNNTTETATYSIYVVDRAKNHSDTVQTPVLTIVSN